MGARIFPIVSEVWRLDRKWILGCLGAEGGLVLGGERSSFPGLTRPATRATIGFVGGFDLWGSFFWGLALDRVMRGPDQT